MSKHWQVGTAAFAALAAATLSWVYWSAAQQVVAKEASEPKDGAKPESAAIAAVRKTAGEFTRAFNAGDAKTVAAFWTKNGEYTGPEGETVRGRQAIGKLYAEFFKEHPKAHLEVQVESARLLGPQVAREEGTLKLKLPGDREPEVSRYSVLHVREKEGWRMASVREWVPNPDELVSIKELEWLVGDWTAKGNGGEAHTRYTWDEDRAFLRCRYTLQNDGKTLAAGTQIIGKDPAGGLRSWLFDRSGSIGESTWTHEKGRWVIEAKVTLPDGSEMTATNILIPLGKDTFTWQSVARKAAGSELPDTPPLKVTRVKAEK
jgi:uncharacterized protein (TIGR02246 family)